MNFENLFGSVDTACFFQTKPYCVVIITRFIVISLNGEKLHGVAFFSEQVI